MKKLLAILLGLVMCLPFFASCEGLVQQSLSIGEFPTQMNMYEEYKAEIVSQGIDETDIVWSTSDTKVLQVKDGVITAVGMGIATVTATYGEYTHSGEILVMRNKVARALTVSKASITMNVGEEEKVTATLKESGAIIESANIVWESSLPDVISVDQEGNIKALQRGQAIVSAYVCYKGQDFVKDIPVRATVMNNATTTLALQEEGVAGTSLTELGSEKAQYGFADGETAYHYVTSGGMNTRIFSNDAYTAENEANYDRLVFKIRFTKQPLLGTMLYLANYRKGVKCDNQLVSRDTCFTYYDEQGNIAQSFDVNTTYTVSINLNKTGNGAIKGGAVVYEYGLAFMEQTEAYVGGAVLCSDDYASDVLGLIPPVELPDMTCIYSETGTSVELGLEPMAEFDKYWFIYSTGTEAGWDECMWNDRVAVGGVSFTDYRKYQYMRMDIMFTAVNMRNIYIWNGGDSFSYAPSGYIDKSTIVAGYDFTVFLGETDVTGQPLLANKVYTFRIRIHRDNLDNVAFGFNVNSPTADIIYLANPMLTNY